MHRPKSDRIRILEKRLKWLESCYHRNIGSNKTSINGIIKETKEELSQLQAEEEKRERSRGIPLLSSKITGYRFYCHDCWDKTYQLAQQEERKRKA